MISLLSKGLKTHLDLRRGVKTTSYSSSSSAAAAASLPDIHSHERNPITTTTISSSFVAYQSHHYYSSSTLKTSTTQRRVLSIKYMTSSFYSTKTSSKINNENHKIPREETGKISLELQDILDNQAKSAMERATSREESELLDFILKPSPHRKTLNTTTKIKSGREQLSFKQDEENGLFIKEHGTAQNEEYNNVEENMKSNQENQNLFIESVQSPAAWAFDERMKPVSSLEQQQLLDDDNTGLIDGISSVPSVSDISLDTFEDAIQTGNVEKSMQLFKLIDGTDLIFSLNENHLDKLMSLVIKSKKPPDLTEIHTILDRIQHLDVKPSLSFYNNILLAYALNGGVISRTQLILKQMESTGLTPSLQTLNLVLMNYTKSGQEEAAIKFFETKFTESGVEPNEQTFAILVDFYLKQGQVEKAQQLITEKEGQGVLTDSFVQRSFSMHFLENNDLERALEHYLHAVEKSETLIDPSWTRDIFEKWSDPGLVDEMIPVVQQLQGRRVQFDVQTLDFILDAMFGAERFEEAFQLLRYTIVEHKIAPSFATSEILMHWACNEEKDFDKALQILELLKSVHVSPSVEMYEMLIEAYIREDNLDDVLVLFKDMKRNRVVSTRVYNALLIGYGYRYDSEQTLKLWKEMKRDPLCQPNYISYQTVFKTLVEASSIQESIKILEKMMSVGIEIPGDGLMSLFDACIRTRNYKDAAEILVLIRSTNKGLKTNHVFSALKNFSKEWQYLLLRMLQNEEMQTRSGSVTSGVRDVLSENRSKLDLVHQRSVALMIYRELLSIGIQLHPDTVSSVIRAHHRNGDLMGAVKSWTIMKQQGIHPKESVVEALLLVCKDYGQEKTARTIFQMRDKENWPLTNQAIDSLYQLMAQYGTAKDFIRLVMDTDLDLQRYKIILEKLKQFERLDVMKDFQMFIEEHYPSILEAHLDGMKELERERE